MLKSMVETDVTLQVHVERVFLKQQTNNECRKYMLKVDASIYIYILKVNVESIKNKMLKINIESKALNIMLVYIYIRKVDAESKCQKQMMECKVAIGC